MSAGPGTEPAAKATTLGVAKAVPSALSLLAGLINFQHPHPVTLTVTLVCLVAAFAVWGYERLDAIRSRRAREQAEQDRYTKETQLREDFGRQLLTRHAEGDQAAASSLSALLGVPAGGPK